MNEACLLNFHSDAGHTCFKFCLPRCFGYLCNELLEVVFPINDVLLNITIFVGSQSFISLPSFSAAVSEIYVEHEGEGEIDYLS